MAFHIGDKIEAVRQEIATGENEGLANQIARDGLAAIFAGIGRFDRNGVVVEVTPEWKTLMGHFANNKTELARLCGKDRLFNGSDWGQASLAYIVGDSTCTIQTAGETGTGRSMNLHPERNMLGNLDAEPESVVNFTGLDLTFTGM
jgi:hypothetical protein